MNLTTTEWTDFESGLMIRVANVDSEANLTFKVMDSFGDVLNKDGFFEHEPMPSNRSDVFLERCRFSSFNEAANALENYDRQERATR